jgi:hypothetical protein
MARRTPVLFMFGRHGMDKNIEGPLLKRIRQKAYITGDQRFFRKSFEKFFKNRILAEGRRGVVIYELVITPEMLTNELERRMDKQ